MIFFKTLYLFMIGSIGGWCLELLFRRFFSAKKWINPGFLVGPYLPLYGSGVVLMFAITFLIGKIDFANEAAQAIITILVLGLAMTLIEYITGLIFIKGMNIKLWDYTDRWGNIQGIICPLFCLFWLIICALYYFLIHDFISELVIRVEGYAYWLFFIGIFFGVFIVDIGYSFKVASKIRKFAKESKVLIKYEHLKKSIAEDFVELSKKRNFLFPFKSPYEIGEAIKSYIDKSTMKIKETFEKKKENE